MNENEFTRLLYFHIYTVDVHIYTVHRYTVDISPSDDIHKCNDSYILYFKETKGSSRLR